MYMYVQHDYMTLLLQVSNSFEQFLILPHLC